MQKSVANTLTLRVLLHKNCRPMYEQILRPCLFKLSPENAHNLSIQSLKVATSLRLPLYLLKRMAQPEGARSVKLWDLEFPNAIGLAAGMDKDAEVIAAMLGLGFGFVEVGTVTPNPQPGNDKPRLFRYPATHAIVNRMGFNNAGVDALVRRVLAFRKCHPQARGIVGINIGKQKETPISEATRDYIHCFDAVADLADYVAVNISSPNTQNLRQLQDREPLEALLKSLNDRNHLREKAGKRRVPTLLKIAPDLSDSQLETMVQLVVESNWHGMIATNTTIDRTGDNAGYEFPGGLSGAPVRERSTEVIRKIHQLTHGKLPIIGVGGVETGAHAQEKLDAGASLIQVYSGFIYQGPCMIRRMLSQMRS